MKKIVVFVTLALHIVTLYQKDFMPFLYNVFHNSNAKILLFLLISTCFIQNTKPEVSAEVASELKQAVGYALGASLTGVCGLFVKERIKFLKEELVKLENKHIEDWILENNLNAYGEPHETEYNNGCPLASDQTRYAYIVNKFPDKPWFKEFENLVKIINTLNKLSTGMVVTGYSIFTVVPIICFAIWAYCELNITSQT